MEDIAELSLEELKKRYEEIWDEWYKSNLVHSLTDFEEIVKELTERKYL